MYIKIGQYLINAENGHTFQLESWSATQDRILSNGKPILCDSKEAIKGAFQQIEDAVLKNNDVIPQILAWIEKQKEHDADEERYEGIKEFVQSLIKQ